MTLLTYQNLLDFWFDPSIKPKWFVRDPEFDQLLRERFYSLYTQSHSSPQTAEEALAQILLFDQLPRNFFRGNAQAFATDAKALALCKDAWNVGWDRLMDAEKRLFMGMPLMHSENLADQALSLHYFSAHPDALVFAQQHYDVISKFGRFPRRNEALGRISTAKEIAFLESNGFTW